MRNNMACKTILSPYMTNVRMQLHDKIIEFKQRTADFNQFALYMQYFNQFAPNKAKYEDINDTIKATWKFIKSGQPFKTSDETGMKNAIEMMNKVIQELNQFTLENYTIVSNPNKTPILEKLAKAKQTENNKLVEYIKKYNPLSNHHIIGTNADLFYQNINFSPFNKNLKEDLKSAVNHFDLAISNMKQNAKNMKKIVFKKYESQEWLDNANNDIDNLLSQAIKEMKNHSPKTSTEGIINEIRPIICGTQSHSNCWMYSLQNIINFIKFIKNENIIKNSGKQDKNEFDNIEREFNNLGFNLSVEAIKKQSSSSVSSNILNQLNLNHSRTAIYYQKNDIKNIETMHKIAKLLLIKHFTNSITPVEVGIQSDYLVRFNENNNHSVVIAGIDIDTNQVVVLDPNFNEPQIYSLDRMVGLMCDSGYEDEFGREINVLFPSFTNVNNFHYISEFHSWSEFKTQLLPAISKTF